MAKKKAKAKPKARATGEPKPNTNRTRQTTAPDWCEPFLAALRQRGNIRASCEAAGVARTTVYFRRANDPPFAAAMSEAIEDAADDLEAEAWRRAVEGCTRPVYGSGGAGVGTVQVGEITEYSDALMVLLLKAHKPGKYRENVKVEHGGHVEVTVSANELSDDELASIAARGDAPAGGG